MERKLNKKNIIIISIIILIIVVEIINPIKLYNKHVLKQLNYSNSSIETILKYGKKDEVLNSKNNQVLDKIFSSKDYIDSNFNIYKDLNELFLCIISYMEKTNSSCYSDKELLLKYSGISSTLAYICLFASNKLLILFSRLYNANLLFMSLNHV